MDRLKGCRKGFTRNCLHMECRGVSCPDYHFDLEAFKYHQAAPEAGSECMNLLNALSALIKGHKRLEAPRKTTYHGKHYQYTIGIGNDYIATLTIEEDALKALNDMGI